MSFHKITVVAVSLLLAACATKPIEIVPVAAPAYTYASYDCDQILAEAESLAYTAVHTYRAQVRRVKNDNQMVFIGFMFSWPALFFIEGDGVHAEEIAILKGRMEALEKASAELNQPGCKVTFTNM